MFAQLRRYCVLGVLLCTGALAACIPEDKDPAKTSDAGQLNGSYYASALGNVALKVQNWVVGDPDWFTQTVASNVTLANLGIDANVVGGVIRSSVCPTGTGTEVLQLTWLDGRDSANRFSMRGIGTNTGIMMGALRNRVAGDQVATYDGSPTLQVANGTTKNIPSSCSGLSIPLGAPVLVFQIDRPAAPVEELAKTEYRTVACGLDTRGMQMRGTMVESRVIRYTAEGVITPSDPNTGWSAESMGTCVSDAIVTANTSTTTNGGSVALNNFADITANNLKAVLEQQLEMDCATTSINSDVMKKNQNGIEERSKKDKNIDTCTKAAASAASSQVRDNDTGNADDTRDVCVEKSTTFGNKTFLGVNGGTLTSVLAGTAFVDRTLDNRNLSSNASQTAERLKWIGRPNIACTSNDTYVAQCGQIPGAPPRSTDFAAAGNKWTFGSLDWWFDDEAWYNDFLGFCFIGCTYIEGGGIYALNWNYFREKRTLHADTDTSRAVGSRNATTWLDRFTNFTPNFVYGVFTVPAGTNQCRIRYKEIQLSCPLGYNPVAQSTWTPYELSPNEQFQTTLIPGGSYGGRAGQAYNSAHSSSNPVGYAYVNMAKCNIKGCDRWTETAGPGLSSYIISWRYGDASSYNGAGTSVQTIMLNREPQMYDLVPSILSGPRMSYHDRVYLPGRGLHCGRIERRTWGSWPVLVRYWSCGGKGGCRLNSYWSSTTVEEVVTREWYGENASTGTWSRPNVRYVVSGGVYGSIGAIPNPIVSGP